MTFNPNLCVDYEEAIRAVCPIVADTVKIGKRDDRATWTFTPAPEATPAQIAAGLAVAATFVTKRRKPRAAITAALRALSNPDRKKLHEAIADVQDAEFLAEHPDFAEQNGINLRGDEPDPDTQNIAQPDGKDGKPPKR